MSETVAPPVMPQSPDGSGRVPHQRGGEGFSAPVWPTEVLDRVGPPVDVPEVTTPQVIDVEPVAAPSTESVGRVGRMATWAAKLEAAAQPASPESSEASKARVSAWLAPGVARADANRGKFMARLRRWGTAIGQKASEVKESTVRTLGDAAKLGRAAARLAVPAAYSTVESGKNLGRKIADSAVAYSHEVRANVAEVKANSAFAVERAAEWRTNRSEEKIAKHQAKLDKRIADVQHRRAVVDEHVEKGQFARAALKQLRGRVPAYLAGRSARKLGKNTDKANARMVTQLNWEDRTDRNNAVMDAHRAAADARRGRNG